MPAWGLPKRLYDSIAIRAELRWEEVWLAPPRYAPRSVEDLLRDLSRQLDSDLSHFLDEPALAAIEEHVKRGIHELGDHPALPRVHHGDSALARICYALCRAAKPDLLVETGVAYGVSSAYLLAALRQNGNGHLHSIDRFPFDPTAEQRVGALVSTDLRDRWTLHKGTGRTVLPRLLPTLGKVGFFLHDSRHTYRNILGEMEAVTPYLTPGALVLADDIERNVAFEKWVERRAPVWSATIAHQDKEGLFGVAAMRS